ncbi:unnamed protein product [Lepeophtheirus salmonis]|uniref:(salmon louse) hypothetical protein n=1 Tax=Lepeophtheirus salmonis TaxID=72036 RepID=A0A7R8H2W2_LEPSM|nr:unnamed protein product [Lepeophtheirus salmonis]CAF2830685.1 unnamed protein product [Lepeophtheirus salmonis]
MQDSNKYCGIVMDEMSIESTLKYDVGDQLVRGYDTFKPSSDELTTHALVFVLVGVKTRWKQVVAYHFTGSSFNKKDVALVLKEIAIAAHKSRVFFIFADVPHLLKNLCNHLTNDQDITLTADIVSTYKLPSSTISLQPFQDLILFQRDQELKLQPRLSPKNLLSHATGSAIRFLVDKFDYPESYLTTAWYCEQVDHWFDLMTSRNLGTALTEKKFLSLVKFSGLTTSEIKGLLDEDLLGGYLRNMDNSSSVLVIARNAIDEEAQ